MNEINSKTHSTKRLVIGGGVALAAAAAIAVAFVLPAEFGIDPLGLGKAMGLSDLSRSGEMTALERAAQREGSVLTLSDAPILRDHWEVELEPYGAIEFKYTMDKGAGMLFAWHATDKLNYDMHSHPFDGGVDMTESYAVDAADAMRGTYVAPFNGIHGWYWQNRTLDNVTLTLDAVGGFSDSSLFDSIGEHKRPIEVVE
jgi:hypothetical protein